MEQPFALEFTDDGLSFFRRNEKGWVLVSRLNSEQPDFETALQDCRKMAKELTPEGMGILLILPNSVVKYFTIDIKDAQEAQWPALVQDAVMRLEASGHENRLIYDWLCKDGTIFVAATAQKIVDDFENFARQLGFIPHTSIAAGVDIYGGFSPFFGFSRIAEQSASTHTRRANIAPILRAYSGHIRVRAAPLARYIAALPTIARNRGDRFSKRTAPAIASFFRAFASAYYRQLSLGAISAFILGAVVLIALNENDGAPFGRDFPPSAQEYAQTQDFEALFAEEDESLIYSADGDGLNFVEDTENADLAKEYIAEDADANADENADAAHAYTDNAPAIAARAARESDSARIADGLPAENSADMGAHRAKQADEQANHPENARPKSAAISANDAVVADAAKEDRASAVNAQAGHQGAEPERHQEPHQQAYQEPAYTAYRAIDVPLAAPPAPDIEDFATINIPPSASIFERFDALALPAELAARLPVILSKIYQRALPSELASELPKEPDPSAQAADAKARAVPKPNPAEAPPVPAAPPAPALEDTILYLVEFTEIDAQYPSNLRPMQRPMPVFAEILERRQFGGFLKADLAKIYPTLKPQSEQARLASRHKESAQSPVIVASPIPYKRPVFLEKKIQRLSQNQRIQAHNLANRAIAHTIPKKLAEAATIKDGLKLGKDSLIGIFGKPSSRRALILQGNGNVVRLRVGDSFNGGKVAVISENALKYVKTGRVITLYMPKI